MRRALLALTLILALLPADLHAEPPTLRVMTWNVFVGFDVDDITAALATGDPAAVVLAVRQAFEDVKATDFAARADALAREVARQKPDVIGLQEMALFRSQDPADPLSPATTVEFDFLALLQAALAARGLAYDVVAVFNGLDVELPALREDFSCCREIRLTDREVLLVRQGVQVMGSDSGGYANVGLVPCSICPGGFFGAQRGWVSADVVVGGQTVRVVSTHLEVEAFEAAQVGQAGELLSGPAATSLPVVLLGDFNSRADGTGTPTHALLLADGFDDAWLDAHPNRPGFTCCHAPDLLNAQPTFDRRIDFVLVRGGVHVINATVEGDQKKDRRPSGLWPSDHAGLSVKLRVLPQ